MHTNKVKANFNNFRKEVKQKINEIYAEERTLFAINTDNPELQEIIGYYDEDYSNVYIEMLEEEINNFKNNKIDDAY